MRTDIRLRKDEALRTSTWGSLVGIILLATIISAVFRIFGVVQDRPLLVSYGVAAWKIQWLFVSPVVLIISNLLGWLFLWQRWKGYLWLAWVAFTANLLSYWAERLLVWSSDQNLQGNLWFMIILFGAYFALMLLFTLDLKTKDRN
ncbi:MAG TPA: hypothetical protein VLR89_05180 [Anaerolineaceae bacterium]|nr:hypothetical protein [Anaerolineaceae bacterium]